ncbi:hypothetical protein N9385_04100 [Candidatus Nitrosopelagicus sp.]|nr:hypothetical protein [Candidatus Nitrosopelagicus sp.]
MRNNPGFRAWFYFRQGWSTYFAFIFAATNTLTVTYYLAIENYPSLKSIFPSFEQYIIIVVLVGIPLLIGIGYAHYKKTPSYRAEADVWMESNPYWARVLVNTQLSLTLNMKLTDILLKSSSKQEITQNEINEIKELQTNFIDHMENRTLSNKKDQAYFKENYKL